MSRNIAPRHSVTLNENDRSLRNTVSGKLLFTKYKESPCALLIRDNRLRAVSFFPTGPAVLAPYISARSKKLSKIWMPALWKLQIRNSVFCL